MQQSFIQDPTLSDRLFTLLETTFSGITQKAEFIKQLGASWELVSTPFIQFQDGVAIAHVGVLELPLQLMGQPVPVGGIHAVCTHPQFRRQGHYRRCMETALEYCDRRYSTLVLTTSQPELYQPFGFRVVPEYAFIVRNTTTSRKDGFRLLNWQDAADLNLIHRLLNERKPVSQVVGVRPEKAVFFFNEANQPLYYAEDLDAIAVMEIEGNQLRLFDIVAPHLWSLTAILERIAKPIDEVAIYFSPDGLQVDAQPVPDILDGDSLFMVRGSFAVEGELFMLPGSARC